MLLMKFYSAPQIGNHNAEKKYIGYYASILISIRSSTTLTVFHRSTIYLHKIGGHA